MTLFRGLAAGLSIQMSQTSQQEQRPAPAKPGARRDLELFWRIIAGLMLIVIAWVAWVAYQIAPKSVATPLAYDARAKSMFAPQKAAGDSAPGALPPAPTSAVQATAPGLPPAPAGPAAADLAMDSAQAAARAGAHQSSADVQAAALEAGRQSVRGPERVMMDGLRLSTEIASPPAANK
jgi:hypothetical protein